MSSKTDSLPRGTRIGRTALRVNDLDEVTEFYRTVVGLSVLDESDTRAVLGVSDTALLVLERAPDAPARHRSGAGLYHTAFRVPSRTALGDALARIREHWRLDGASDHGVSEALYLTDPEGNGVELYRDFPRDDWPRGDDGRVRMGSAPLDLDRVGAAAMGETQAPSETDVGHIHLEVSSLDAFKEIYVDGLGFDVQTEVPAASFVSAAGYHHHVGANTWHHRSEPNDGRGLSWFEVVVPEQSALEAIGDRLVDHGIPVATSNDGLTVTAPDDIEVRVRVDASQS